MVIGESCALCTCHVSDSDNNKLLEFVNKL